MGPASSNGDAERRSEGGRRGLVRLSGALPGCPEYASLDSFFGHPEASVPGCAGGLFTAAGRRAPLRGSRLPGGTSSDVLPGSFFSGLSPATGVFSLSRPKASARRSPSGTWYSSDPGPGPFLEKQGPLHRHPAGRRLPESHPSRGAGLGGLHRFFLAFLKTPRGARRMVFFKEPIYNTFPYLQFLSAA